jgi:maleylacetoacetate isomerase
MIKLYSYFRSSSSYRVRIALNLKGLDYEIMPVHLLNEGGEQFKESFTKLNAAHRIPVLIHDDKVIAQSVAIIEYLDSLKTDPSLLPPSEFQKAQARQLIEIINSDIQPLQNLSVLKKLVKDHGFSEEEKVKWIQHWITLGFQSYESLVKKTAGTFSVGDKPTAPDCFLIPQVFNALRFQVDMETFPTIHRIHEAALKHPAFEKAHPNNQPDAPEN